MNSTDSLQIVPPPPTRQQAMRAGRRTYRGRPCRIHGPEALRYLTNSACKQCAIASAIATKLRERALRAGDDDIDGEEG